MLVESEVCRVKKIFMALSVLFLIACSGASREQQQEAEDVYIPPPGGLLVNPGFELAADGRMQGWGLIQHAGPKSYIISSSGGVASIERIDEEPWGMLVQTFRRKDTQSMQGKVMEFSAEVSGEFTNAYGEPIKPAGLNVTVRGIPAGANPLFGSSVLFSEVAPIVPIVGRSPWQRYSIQFDVPAVDEASFIEIEVSVFMSYGGVMRVRGPSFVVKE